MRAWMISAFGTAVLAAPAGLAQEPPPADGGYELRVWIRDADGEPVDSARIESASIVLRLGDAGAEEVPGGRVRLLNLEPAGKADARPGPRKQCDPSPDRPCGRVLAPWEVAETVGEEDMPAIESPGLFASPPAHISWAPLLILQEDAAPGTRVFDETRRGEGGYVARLVVMRDDPKAAGEPAEAPADEGYLRAWFLPRQEEGAVEGFGASVVFRRDGRAYSIRGFDVALRPEGDPAAR